jgi:hypothetical protein
MLDNFRGGGGVCALKSCSSTVQNTVYGPWVLSGAKWGRGGVYPARSFFELGGAVGESRFDFYFVVGERGEIFLIGDY